MTEFGGFEMPVQYTGILNEHRAVRTAAGLFDLSHMGEFDLRGHAALPMLERVLTNSAARLGDRQAQYTILCANDGGTIDDLIVYRRAADHYILCVNASNIAADWAQFSESRPTDVDLQDVSEQTALMAIQGPRAEAILAPLSNLELNQLGRFHFSEGLVAGIDCLVARTGYTGEDGFELFVKADRAVRLFESLMAAGAPSGLQPCGLGARDTLRMEAGLPLYGHELDRHTSPLEAGLGVFVKFGHGFIGEAALADQRTRGLRKRLIGLRTDDGKSIARQGYGVFQGESRVGVVTSGTFAPTFDRPLAMAYVDAAAGINPTQSAVPLEVEIRGRRLAATTLPLPFYRRKKSTTD
jgi:aminomethyltransferase